MSKDGTETLVIRKVFSYILGIFGDEKYDMSMKKKFSKMNLIFALDMILERVHIHPACRVNTAV
jgi:hypothetical protein